MPDRRKRLTPVEIDVSFPDFSIKQRKVIGLQDDLSALYAAKIQGDKIWNSNGKTWKPTAVNIQIAINDLLSSGGSVYIPPGSYTTMADLTFVDNLHLFGAGWSTKIVLGTGLSTKIDNNTNVTVSNLQIDASSQGSGVPAMWIMESNNIIIDTLRIKDCTGMGVDIYTTDTQDWITIKNSFINGLGYADVIGGGPDDMTPADKNRNILIVNNRIHQDISGAGTYDNAIDLVNVYKVKFLDNFVYGNIVFGAEWSPHTYSEMRGNTIEPAAGSNFSRVLVRSKTGVASPDNFLKFTENIIKTGQVDLVGISGQTLRRSIIANNIIDSNSSAANAINLDYCSLLNVSSNVIEGATVGIHADNTDSSLFVNNVVNDCTTGMDFHNACSSLTMGNIFSGVTNPIVNATGMEIRYNPGYETENSGTSTGTGSQQTIAHSLAGNLVPNSVVVTPSVTGATVSAVWADATNIYCTVTNNKAYGWTARVL